MMMGESGCFSFVFWRRLPCPPKVVLGRLLCTLDTPFAPHGSLLTASAQDGCSLPARSPACYLAILLSCLTLSKHSFSPDY